MKKSCIALAAVLACTLASVSHAQRPMIPNVFSGMMDPEQLLGPPPGVWLPWAKDYEFARRNMKAQDWADAVGRYESVLREIDEYGARYQGREGFYSYHQRVALANLARALRAMERTPDALVHLERLLVLEAEERAVRTASGHPGRASLTSAEAAAIFKSAADINAFSASHLGRRLITVEMEGSALDEALAVRMPKVDLTMVDLTQVYAELGMREKAFAIFDGPFQEFLQRQRANNNPDPLWRMNLNVGVENACLNMAIALSRLGASPQADQAFDCARRESSKNYLALGVNNTMGFMHDAAVERRRLFMGAYATYVFSRGQASDTRDLLALIAETKGASNRYRERRRSIWTHSTDPGFFRARQQFANHERRLTDMSLAAGSPIMALANWTREERTLMDAFFNEFQKAGIGEVFTPGEEILSRSQSKLEKRGLEIGGEEGLIGFAVYRPVNFEALQFAPSRVLRYVVSKNGSQVKDIGSAAEISRQVRLWRSSVIAGAEVGNETLSTQLLDDLPPEVLAAKSWVIDPDGPLSVLPFEALVAPSRNGERLRVIDHHSVRYVTSIAEFAEPARPQSLAKSAQAPQATAVIVADPVFADAGGPSQGTLARELRTSSGELLRNLQLQPLPETREEADQVASALKTMGAKIQLHTGSKASLEAFDFREAPKYLHVATHGVFLEPGITLAKKTYVRLATALPGLQSALALSTSDRGSILTGADIARLNLLGTDLVVFSACDTGNGEFEAGEGVASLRRSVEEAGASSSITSLWPVPSKATAILMAEFYKNLAAGQSKAEALRQAKLSLMKSLPEVINWAGFLLAGEP